MPGPSDYNPELPKNDITQQSPAFILPSDTSRKISEPILQHSPPVGSYNVDIPMGSHRDNLNLSLMRPGKNVLTMKNGSMSKDILGFNSETKRFSDSSSQVLGPGHYNTPSVFDLPLKKSSPSKHFSQSRRFESYGSYLNNAQDSKQQPGPGFY